MEVYDIYYIVTYYTSCKAHASKTISSLITHAHKIYLKLKFNSKSNLLRSKGNTENKNHSLAAEDKIKAENRS